MPGPGLLVSVETGGDPEHWGVGSAVEARLERAQSYP